MTKHMPLLGFAGGSVLNHTPAMKEKQFHDQSFNNSNQNDQGDHLIMINHLIIAIKIIKEN